MKTLYHRFSSGEPWAILPSGALEFASKFSYEVPRVRAQDGEDLWGNKHLTSEMRDGVGIVTVSGPFISACGFLEKLFGAVSQQDLCAELESIANRDPSAIVVCWNSPGGTVAATPEAAHFISELSATIPIISYVESGTCASAAYWMAASARRIVATESSNVGSIGVLLEVVSFADALAAAGIDARTISSSDLKSTGHPFSQITDARQGYLQSTVDSIAGGFAEAIRGNRPDVDESALDGRIFTAREAMSLGLVDDVVQNIGDVLGGIRSGSLLATIPNKGPKEKKLKFKRGKNPDPTNPPPPPKKGSAMDFFRKAQSAGAAIVYSRRNVISSGDFSPEQLRKFKKLC